MKRTEIEGKLKTVIRVIEVVEVTVVVVEVGVEIEIQVRICCLGQIVVVV
jgi:hypothetical protein